MADRGPDVDRVTVPSKTGSSLPPPLSSQHGSRGTMLDRHRETKQLWLEGRDCRSLQVSQTAPALHPKLRFPPLSRAALPPALHSVYPRKVEEWWCRVEGSTMWMGGQIYWSVMWMEGRAIGAALWLEGQSCGGLQCEWGEQSCGGL